MTETLVSLGLMLAAIIGVIGISIYFGKKKGRILQAQFLATKVLYEKTLNDLEFDPSNSEKYQAALAKGREYYSYLHPNTYDMNRNGVTSNHQDNSGVVELKVQSDLQARTLKSKGKIS